MLASTYTPCVQMNVSIFHSRDLSLFLFLFDRALFVRDDLDARQSVFLEVALSSRYIREQPAVPPFSTVRTCKRVTVTPIICINDGFIGDRAVAPSWRKIVSDNVTWSL